MLKDKFLAGGTMVFTTAIIGGWHITLQVLLVLMGVDVVSGMMKGWSKGDFASKAMREGLKHKAGFFLVLILANQVDIIAGGGYNTIRNIVASFYIGVEGISIIENLGLLGVPVPKFLVARMKAFKDLADNENKPK